MTAYKGSGRFPPYPRAHQQRGFTLAEVILAILISVIIGLGAMSLLLTVSKYMRLQKERVVAAEILANKLEQIKQILYPNITPSVEGVTMDVPNTPGNPADDLPATLEVVLKDKHGNIMTGPPSGKDMIELQLSLNWNSAGKERSQMLFTYLAP